ncbi:MAG: phosphoglycerate kinase, partial [Acidilobaceae archaeon]
VLSYMGKRIATLDNVNFKGKKVLLRIDINSPINPASGDILDVSRIAEHSITVKELVEGGAAVTVISHQGRPLDSDFTSLKAHANILSNMLGVDVKFVDDVIGPEARRAIEALEPGEVLVLDNTRLLAEDNIEAPPDKHSESFIVRKLAPLFHLFVNDAFATCHRSQATIVGFPLKIPSVAGRVLEKELRALNKVVEMEDRPKVFVLGGAKLDDTVKVIKYVVESGIADYVLTTGLVSLLFLLAKGVKVPKDVEKTVLNKVSTDNFGEARGLASKHGNIRTPIDFMVEERGAITRSHYSRLGGAPKDIGPSTIEYYGSILSKAKIIVMRGPAGVIEDPRFRAGTEELVRRALGSDAFTVFGGGHFNAMLSNIPEKLKARIGHISTGGGALLYFLSGKPLPGLEALARSNEIFKVVD